MPVTPPVYSEAAPQVFQDQLNALLTTYRRTTDGMYYTTRIGASMTAALGVVNVILKNALADQTPCDVTTYLLPAYTCASGLVYSILTAINSNTATQADALITLGSGQGFFKSVPIISDLEQGKRINPATAPSGAAEQQQLLADGLRYRHLGT